MADYSLQLKTKDAGTGKARTLTLTNVNPETSSNVLKQFTQKLNQLTTNTYEETNLIIKTNLDTETPPIDTRPTPTISASGIKTLSDYKSSIGSISNVTITYTGDGITYISRKTGCEYIFFMSNSNTNWFTGTPAGTQATSITGGTVIVGAYGTENYKPVEIEVTIE